MIKSQLRRNLTLTDPRSPLAANFDEHDEADDETTGNLHREINEAEEGNHDSGKPGSFLNRLISHGNKKTEEQIRKENEAKAAAAAAAHDQ